MTNEARNRKTTGNIHELFPKKFGTKKDSTENWPSAELASLGESIEEIKSLFDAQLAIAITRSMQQGTSIDNPFDAVYLSELQPDELVPTNISQLAALSHVKDLSSTIHFDDGLDD